MGISKLKKIYFWNILTVEWTFWKSKIGNRTNIVTMLQ